jgi:hypothetical protein
VSFLADNIGRKLAIILSFGIMILGILIMALSQKLFVAEIGLFLAGFGSDSALNICFYFIS